MHRILQRRFGQRSTTVRGQKSNARKAIERALIRGEITRPETCDDCGNAPRPQANGRSGLDAHHDDYAKPFDVFWLCRVCHAARHSSDKPRRPLPVGTSADASDPKEGT